jgi:transcriptional accessory protein Tex/SPT6
MNKFEINDNENKWREIEIGDYVILKRDRKTSNDKRLYRVLGLEIKHEHPTITMEIRGQRTYNFIYAYRKATSKEIKESNIRDIFKE